jgi:hypothetical protein
LRRPRLATPRRPHLPCEHAPRWRRWRWLVITIGAVGLTAACAWVSSCLVTAYRTHRREVEAAVRAERIARVRDLLDRLPLHPFAPLRSLSRVPGTRLYLNPEYHVYDPDPPEPGLITRVATTAGTLTMYTTLLAVPLQLYLRPWWPKWWPLAQSNASTLPCAVAPIKGPTAPRRLPEPLPSPPPRPPKPARRRTDPLATAPRSPGGPVHFHHFSPAYIPPRGDVFSTLVTAVPAPRTSNVEAGPRGRRGSVPSAPSCGRRP